ncbi:MAG: hypothetical protein KDA32_12315 [Phycisphaerales bacterium]|nr:hypothetical protein [Phycisphaerales bacterium]
MRKRDLWLAAFVSVLTIGSLGASVAYALFLRSDSYRHHCASRLTDSIRLPAEIGFVRPQSFSAREFGDILIYLPNHRGLAMRFDSAIVKENSSDSWALALDGGVCEISSRTWLRTDYRDVLEAGLRPGLSDVGPDRVDFQHIDLRIRHEAVEMELDDAAGEVSFQSNDRGEAFATCNVINGHNCEQPVTLKTTFSRDDGRVRLDQAELTVPLTPLPAMRLEALTGVAVTHGEFGGRLSYSEGPDGLRVVASGVCHDLLLSELSGLAPRAWRGRCPDIEVMELAVRDRAMEDLRFRGVIEDVDLGDVLATWGIGDLTGSVSLTVGGAHIDRAGVRRLTASGRVVAFSVEGLLRLLGLQGATGDLEVHIEEMRVEDNRIASLTATARIAESDTPNRIEGRLLADLAERVLESRLPPVIANALPEQIEYTRLGCRIEIRDELLTVYGLYGDDGRTIMIARLFGLEVPIIQAPERTFDLRQVLGQARINALRRLNELTPPAREPPRSE